jgi:hypothetical protein
MQITHLLLSKKLWIIEYHYLDKESQKTTSTWPVKLQVYSVITKKQRSIIQLGKDLSKDDYDDIFKSDKNVHGSKNETKIFFIQIESRANEVAKDISPLHEVFEKKMFRNTVQTIFDIIIKIS